MGPAAANCGGLRSAHVAGTQRQRASLCLVVSAEILRNIPFGVALHETSGETSAQAIAIVLNETYILAQAPVVSVYGDMLLEVCPPPPVFAPFPPPARAPVPRVSLNGSRRLCIRR